MLTTMRANTRVHNSRPRARRTSRTSPRKEPQQERSRALFETILTAATRVLVKEGYEAATTNRIAEAAGISVGSLYQYFPNKESIVGQLLDRHANAMWEVFAQGVAAYANVPLADAVPAIIDAIMTAHGVEPKLHRVLQELVPRAGRLAKQREMNRRAARVAAQFLAAHRDETDVADIETAAFVLVEAVEALIHASLDSELEDARVRAEAIRMSLRYLGVHKSDAATMKPT
jgi:AcrR family transcriptional regulator